MTKMPIEMLCKEPDTPVVTLDSMMNAFWWFCAGIGFITACFVLYLFSGIWK